MATKQRRECSSCGVMVAELRKGMCGPCYARLKKFGSPEPRRKIIEKCSFCETEKGPFVKGLCKACYYRQKKNGTLEYTRVPKFCSVPGCENMAVARGYCDKHRKRIERGAHDPLVTAHDRGSRSMHPLYHSWKWIMRSYRTSGGIDPRWTEFWNFLEDMGERPERHSLRRHDESKPFGKGNCYWQPPTLDDDERKSAIEYQRAWRIKNPDRARNNILKKKYGISANLFDMMAEEQGHKCAICGEQEGAIDPYNNKPRRLAVDHCHETGRIRDLLCSNCNTALVGFRERIDLLEKAIRYLTLHSYSCDPVPSEK